MKKNEGEIRLTQLVREHLDHLGHLKMLLSLGDDVDEAHADSLKRHETC